MHFERPSRTAVAATAAAGAVLAAGGFFVGRGSQDPGSAATVPLVAQPSKAQGVEIKVPAVAEFPRR